MILCILSSVPEYLRFPILIWKFPVVDDIFNFLHLSSILIHRAEDVDNIFLVHQFLTAVYAFHHSFYFLLLELL